MGRRLATELLGALTGALALAGLVAPLFLLLWGVHYARSPLEERVGWRVDGIESAELIELCEALRDDANGLRAPLPEDESGVLRLAGERGAWLERAKAGFERGAALSQLLEGAPSRPKGALLGPLMSRLGITGIYSPFTGEPHVNLEVTDAELLFAATHEMAHGLGYAREDEANFIAYLACRSHPDAPFAYSGALEALQYALSALRSSGRASDASRILSSLSEPVLRDLRRSSERIRRMRSKLTEISSEVNDAYLRTQGVRHGSASYGRMLRLMIGERRARGPGRLPGTEAEGATRG